MERVDYDYDDDLWQEVDDLILRWIWELYILLYIVVLAPNMLLSLLELPTFHCWIALLLNFEGSFGHVSRSQWTGPKSIIYIYVPSMSIFMIREVGAPNLTSHSSVNRVVYISNKGVLIINWWLVEVCHILMLTRPVDHESGENQ